jgi:hypothetical protein
VRRNLQHRSLLTVFSATSAPGRASSASFERPWEKFSTQLCTAMRDKQFPTVNRTRFSMDILCIESSAHNKNSHTHTHTHTITMLFGITLLKHGSPFWLLKPTLNLLPRLSCRWIVLLHSDTHLKPITSITAVLRPHVTYLQTLPRSHGSYCTAQC